MKTAWIFPGGAARSVYTAGAIYALCKMNISKPDIIIAASGSAPTIVCYVTNQPEVIPSVWLESLSTRKFVNFWRFWKIVDIDYLIDFVIRKKHPLDIEKLIDSDVKVFFPLTNSDSGEIVYFDNKSKVDIWNVLKAAVSGPIVSNLFSTKGLQVSEEYFCDSAPSSRYEVHVSKAIKEGATRVIVFDNWHIEDNNTSFVFTRILNLIKNFKFMNAQNGYIKEIQNFRTPANIDFIRIEPREKLGMGRFEIDNDNARKIFKRGYDDVFYSEKLRGFSVQ